MKKLKATAHEKFMDSAIAGIRRPYDYKKTMKTLDEAAKISHEYFNELRKKQK